MSIRQMLPTSYRTYRAAPKLPGTRGDPAVIARALRPMRVRVRSLDAAAVFSFEHNELLGLAVGDLPTATAYTSPVLEASEFVMAPGDSLYAVSSGSPFRIAIHRAELVGLQAPDSAAPLCGFKRLVITPRRSRDPVPIARAPQAAPVRVTVRNLAPFAFAGGAHSVAVSTEIADLRGADAAAAYIIPSLGGVAEDTFILAPGEILHAVTVAANDVPISVLLHQGLTDGTFVQMG